MTEEITIKLRAETDEAQENVAGFREEMGRAEAQTEKATKATEKAGKAASNTAGQFSSISKALGSVSPSLGRITKGADGVTKSWQRMGAMLRKPASMPGAGVPTTVQGPMGYGYGTGTMGGGMGGFGGGMGRLGGLGKVGLMAGIGALGGGLLGNLFGGAGGGKLAGFDKLNAIGQQSLFDFLDPRFKDISKKLGDIGGSLSNVAGVLAGVGEGTVNISTNVFTGIHATVKTIGDTIGHWFDGLDVGNVVFENILGLSTDINGITHGWFSGLYEEGERVFKHILGLAGEVLDVIKQWFNIGGGDSNTPTIPDTTPTTTPTNPDTTPAPTSDDADSSSLWDKVKNLTTGAISGVSAVITTIVNKVSDWSDSVADVRDTITDIINPASSGVRVSTKSNNAAVKVAASMIDRQLNMGIGGSNAIGGILGIGGGTVGLASKAANVLGKVGSAIGGLFGFAEGGVFKPNSPQLALLGDNKAEPEVAAPYSLIVQAVGDALRNNRDAITSQAAASTTIEVPISLNGKIIARGIYDDLESERRRRNGSAMA